MNMKVTSLAEETNDENIFNLVIGGGVEAYATGVEQHMIGAVNGPGCRGNILGPMAKFFHIPNVISE
jgi:hypothetical protein